MNLINKTRNIRRTARDKIDKYPYMISYQYDIHRLKSHIIQAVRKANKENQSSFKDLD